MFHDIKVEAEQVRRMKETPNGIIVGRILADRRGWSVGDAVTIESNGTLRLDGSPDWEFRIVGFYDMSDDSSRALLLLLNYRFFDEARVAAKGRVGCVSRSRR